MCRGKRGKFRLKNIRRLFCLCFPLGDKRTDAYVKENIEDPLCSSPTRSDDPEVCVDDTVCALGQDESSPETKAQVHDDDEDCSPRQWIPKRRLLTTDMPPDALLVIVMPDICMDSIPVWGQRDIPACIFTWPSTKSGTLSCMYGYPTSLMYNAICLWQLYLLWQAHTQTGSNLCRDITLGGIAILKNFLMVATEFRHIKDIRKTLINNHYIIHAFVVFVPAHPALYKAIIGSVYYKMITYSYRVPNVGIQNMDITVDRYGDMKLNYVVLPQSRELPLHCPGRMDPSSIPSSHEQHIPYRCSIRATRRPVELPRWKLTMYKDVLPSRVEVMPYSSPMQALGMQAANGQLVSYTGPTQVVTARLSEIPRLNLMFYKDIVSSSVQVFPCSSPLQASFIEPFQGQLVEYIGTMQASTRHITTPKLKLMFHEDNVSSFLEIFTCSRPMEALIMQSSSHGELVPYAGPAQVTSHHIRLPRLTLMFHEDDVSFSVKLFPGSGHMKALIMQSSSHRALVPYAGPAQVTSHHIKLPRLKLMFHENDVSFGVKLFPGLVHMEALIMQSASHRELVPYAGPAQVTSCHIRLPRLKLVFCKGNASSRIQGFPCSSPSQASIIESSDGETVPYTGPTQANIRHIALPRLKLIFQEDDVSFSEELFPGSGHMGASNIQSFHGEIVPYTGPMQANARHSAPPRLDLLFYKHMVSSISQLLSSSRTILPRRRHLLANRSPVQVTVRPTARVHLPQRRQLLAHSIAIHLWPDGINSGRHNDDKSGDDCVAKDIAPDVHGLISTGPDDANDATDTDGNSEYKKDDMTSSSEVPVANTYKSVLHGNFICHMDSLDKQPPVKHAPLVKKHPKAILQEASDPPPQEQMQNEIAALLTVADIQSPSQETSTDLKIPSHVSSLRKFEKDEDVDTKLENGNRCKTGIYEQFAYSLGAAPLFFLHVQINPHLGEDRTKLHDTALAICCLAFSTMQNPRRWDEKQLNLMVADAAGIQATVLQYTKRLNCDIDQLPQDLKIIFESLPCGPQSLRLGVQNVISGSLDNSPSRYYVPSAPDDLLTSLRLIFKLFFNIGAVMWCADTVYAIMRVKLNKIADYKEDRVAILTSTQNDVVMYFFEDLAGCVEFIKCQFEKTESFQLLPVYKYTSYLHHAMRYFKTA